MYPEPMVIPMREELLRAGIKEDSGVKGDCQTFRIGPG